MGVLGAPCPHSYPAGYGRAKVSWRAVGAVDVNNVTKMYGHKG